MRREAGERPRMRAARIASASHRSLEAPTVVLFPVLSLKWMVNLTLCPFFTASRFHTSHESALTAVTS